MVKVLQAIVLALVLAIPIAACGDDDDASSTQPGDVASEATQTTPTDATSPVESTPTMAARASPPSSNPESSTATIGPISTPETGTFTDEEAALIDLLLSARDLEGDWNQLRVEAPELSDSPGICDTPPFPQANERIAEVEVEYQSADGARFVLQDITKFPEDVAIDAMAYVRETATCSEWTDDTGTVFEISPAEAPQLGDESHAIHVAFQVADAGTLEGDFIFVRIDGYVTIVTTLALGGYDPSFSNNVAQLAVRKIDALVGTGSNVTDEESTLMSGLLTLDDLSESWDQLAEPHRSDPESWTGLCGADEFSGSDDAIARVAVEFFEGFEADSATLMQLLVSYPADQIEAAFEHEQDAASCDSFNSGQTDVTLTTDNDFPSLGEDSFAVQFSFDANGQRVEGYWIVIRVADMLSTLIYTDPTDLLIDDVERIARDAADRMESIVR